MIETNQIAVRLNPNDLAVLDALMRRTGLSSASELVRLCLRKYAIAEGVDFEKLKPIATRQEVEDRASKRKKKS